MITIWKEQPPFPESALQSGVRRYRVNGFFVDTDSPTPPTIGDVDAVLNPPFPTPAEKDALGRTELDKMLLLRALIVWLAGKFSLTPAQALDEIIAIYKQL